MKTKLLEKWIICCKTSGALQAITVEFAQLAEKWLGSTLGLHVLKDADES